MTEAEKIEAIKVLTELLKVHYSCQIVFGDDMKLRVQAMNDANHKITELIRSLNI